MSTEPKKLNIGCGSKNIQGWVNLDLKDIPGVDVVHDIENLPSPLFGTLLYEEVNWQAIL